MNSADHILLAFASWEERFALGLQADLSAGPSCSQALVFYFSDYADRTEQARSDVGSLCREQRVKYREVELSTDHPAKNLEEMNKVIGGLDLDISIVVDISTMPREIIWQVFWLCEGRSAPFEYRYHSPASYSEDWLSRSFGRPRLVHKLSGEAASGLTTALLLAVGYDIQRVWQLVRFFEPSKLMIGLQKNSPFRDNDSIMQQYAKEFEVADENSVFEMDAFAQDHGFVSIQKQLHELGDRYNVLLGSLGPKLTAVSLYRVQRKQPKMGLVYAPASEFNDEYSKGIGPLYQGIFRSDGQL